MKKIPLTKNQFALVDDQDYELVSQYKWCADKHKHTYYAYRKVKIDGKNKTIRMHRFISKVNNPKIQIDHIDGNGLNNTRKNLRTVNNHQNRMNQRKQLNRSSKYKGVQWLKCANKWMTRIKHNNKSIYLGIFIEENEAAKAYNKKATELFGQYANLNVIL